MLTRVYDDLPAEMKLHIFSFLSIRDIVAASTVNVHNREIILDEEFWRYRACREFYPDIKEVTSLPSYLLFRRLFHLRLKHEKDLFATYLTSARFIAASEIAQPEKQTEFDLISHSLEHMGEKTFIQMMNCEKYGNVTHNSALQPSSAANQLFKKMVMSDRRQTSLCAKEVLREPLLQWNGSTHHEHLQSLSFALLVLARCNAHLALRIFFRKILDAERRDILHRVGASLLCGACECGSLEAVQELFLAGANPNDRALFIIDEGLTHRMHPIVTLTDLLFKIHRPTTRGRAIKEIIKLFIANGLNADISGMEVLNEAGQSPVITPSLRSQALKLLSYAESHPRLYSNDELIGISEILHLIISAPSYCVLAIPGRDNRNDCARSMHTSLPPPHHRPP